jgi:hypothetical protein
MAATLKRIKKIIFILFDWQLISRIVATCQEVTERRLSAKVKELSPRLSLPSNAFIGGHAGAGLKPITAFITLVKHTYGLSD